MTESALLRNSRKEVTVNNIRISANNKARNAIRPKNKCDVRRDSEHETFCLLVSAPIPYFFFLLSGLVGLLVSSFTGSYVMFVVVSFHAAMQGRELADFFSILV